MPYAPRATLDNPYGPAITFRTEDVLPPSAYYLSPEDQVAVWVMTNTTAQTIFLQLRMLLATGEVKLIPYNFTPQLTYQWYSAFQVPPVEGYLLGAQLWSQTPQRGQTFVSAQIMRGSPPSLFQAGEVLLQGYTNYMSVLSYPTTPLEATFSGRGAFVTITTPTISGQYATFTAPPYTLWKLYTLKFTLTTSAAAGNRLVAVYQSDVNNIQTGVWPNTTIQAPSSTVEYTFAPGGISAQVAPFATIAGPAEMFVPAQSLVGAYVGGMDPADTFTLLAASVEVWVGA